MKKGCVFIPTFQDTSLLDEAFTRSGVFPEDVDVFVFDDNWEKAASDEVAALCAANSWHYRRSHRGPHGTFRQNGRCFTSFNQFIWETFISLGESFDFVVKVETDTRIFDATFFYDFAAILADGPAIAGTPEYRPLIEVLTFWNLARKAGLCFSLSSSVTHMQGGIYGLSSSACKMLRAMGFLGGTHINFRDDCYISYCCQLLGAKFIPMTTTMSWGKGKRPAIETIPPLKAIHPLTPAEFRSHNLARDEADPQLTKSTRSALYETSQQIPKIAHFVWLGGPLPRLAEENIASFRFHHRDWDVRVWRALPENLPADLRRAVLDSPLVVMRSDIVRVWLMFEYGGIYLDTDVFTVRSMEDLRSFENFVPWEFSGRLNNGIIGARAKSKTIGRLVDGIRDLYRQGRPSFILAYGPDLFTQVFYEYRELNPLPVHYFNLFFDDLRAHVWYDWTTSERLAAVRAAALTVPDGVGPFAVHLWGIPSEAMSFNLPRSSIAPSFETGDAILKSINWEESHGLIVGDPSGRLASYLFGFHPHLRLTLARTLGQQNDGTDVTDFAASRRRWTNLESLSALPQGLFDWLCFGWPSSAEIDYPIMERALKALKAGGVAFVPKGEDSARYKLIAESTSHIFHAA
ncbi:MAG: hypothetical protein H0X40_07255 [Chthoniobacterales bacterium]|nr:hypothetical protein [Chthoniobacterales bacterium]